MTEPSTVRTVERLRPFATTIFAEMTALATRFDAVNLGQGFPDTDGPTRMLEVARDAIAHGRNQYPPGPGVPELRAAIVDEHRARCGSDYDADTDVLVTVGATEAISATMLGLVEPGDDVLLVEPYYDSYAATVALAGANRVVVPLRRSPADGRFRLDVDELRDAVTDRTRLLVVNSPHNPTGTVFDRATLEGLAAVAREHDLLVLSDEVYEHLVFDGGTHVPFASLPGMAERTVTVSSAAKTFNVTGWKIGWALGPAPLVDAVRAAKQFLSYTAGAPLQPAVAFALENEREWVRGNVATLERGRDRLLDALSEVGLDVVRPDGGYFVCADIGSITDATGAEFCRSLPAAIGVAAVPVSAFTDHPEQWDHLVRFAFCKRPEVLDEGVRRLRTLRG